MGGRAGESAASRRRTWTASACVHFALFGAWNSRKRGVEKEGERRAWTRARTNTHVHTHAHTHAHTHTYTHVHTQTCIPVHLTCHKPKACVSYKKRQKQHTPSQRCPACYAGFCGAKPLSWNAESVSIECREGGGCTWHTSVKAYYPCSCVLYELQAMKRYCKEQVVCVCVRVCVCVCMRRHSALMPCKTCKMCQ
jgi:hypothetical protein